MGQSAHRLATHDDVLSAPEGMVAEILAGELHLSPRPASGHAFASGGLFGDLRNGFGRRDGGWWLLAEPELHLGRPKARSVVAAPDLAGWRRSRMPVVPRVAAFELAPDWVCEILSPGAAATRRDRVLKPDEHARAGIPHLWLVDPDARTLEVYRLTDGLYTRVLAVAGDVRVRAEPFDAVELDMTEWWLPGGE